MRVAAPSIALAIAQTSVAATVPQLQARQSACSDVHIFTAKGNNEPYPGRQGVLVNAICQGLDNCDYEDILFYNPVESDYCNSVSEGVANGIAQLTSYNARCPDTKLVISGYSQGAHIVSDIVSGGGGTFFNNCQTKPSAAIDVNSAVGKKVAAALVFGNTRHTANQPYNQLGGSGANGLFPRPVWQLANAAEWTSKYHDYCAQADPICAQGGDVADHLNYFDIYTDSAAAWVKSQIIAADVVVTSTVVAPSSTFTSVETVATDKTVATTYAYSNATSIAPKITNSAQLSSIQTAVLAIPSTSATEAVTVSAASVDTTEIASMTSAYAATATVTDTGAYATDAAGALGGAGASGSKTSGAANSTASMMPYAGAASSMSAISGSIAVVLLGAFALVL